MLLRTTLVVFAGLVGPALGGMQHFGRMLEDPNPPGLERLPEMIAYAKSIPLPKRAGPNAWSNWKPAGPDDSRGPCVRRSGSC